MVTYYAVRNFGSASLAARTRAETQPDRTALKNRTASVNERGSSRRKSKLSLGLLIKLRTIAEPEVGLKSNGLNKHHYLN